ncbi:AgmX/PglI C-terminal domain-containing protein [Marinimicrobium alkaliphilum]|uniref:AgmX/PglI C-terminal domain-containing protein n=1 Tax=Marinimicrobium alkaliphilum TaxID=2202654 RepID=UPI000DB91A73|nr:AgmX/PglI C-terminal domain-containing protein [Marinimicrobium alkaliphilum]
MPVQLMPATELPWESSEQEDQRFRRILRVLLILLLLLGIALPLINLPELDREQAAQLPAQLTRVVLETPTPVRVEPEPVIETPVQETQPEPEPRAEPEPAPRTETRPQTPPDAEAVARARERAAQSGLLQMRDELQGMREAFQAPSVREPALARDTSDAPAASAERSRLGRQTDGPAGVDDQTLSRDTAGTSLSARETTQVEAPPESAAAEQAQARAAEPGSRSSEEIRRTIDQHMGGIFAIYNRALRQNPALQGQVVVRLVIEPEGDISDLSIISSELNDPDLEGRLLTRIRMITFEPRQVAQATVNYTFDFLPQ